MMMFTQYPINLIGVLFAAIAAMAVGFAWYSPLFFGKQWMTLMKLTAKDMEKAKKDMGIMNGLTIYLRRPFWVFGPGLDLWLLYNSPMYSLGVKSGICFFSTPAIS